MSDREGPAEGGDPAGRPARPDVEPGSAHFGSADPGAGPPDAPGHDAAHGDRPEGATPDDARPATGRDALDEELDEVLRTTGDPDGSVFTDPVTLATERDEYLLALQHLQADFENYRKRVLRQQEEQTERAALDLVRKLLPALDVLDLAEAHLGTASDDGGATAEATALTSARAMLLETLAKEGLERLDAPGVEFDPVVHDAVAHAPAGEGEEAGMIDEVLRSGYRWRGHVLRPAMVRVRG